MKKKFLILSILIWISSTAHAVVLFENSYDGGGGNNSFSFNGTNSIGAENFALLSDSTVNTISFTAHTNNALPSTIDWWIFSDLTGIPGSFLFSGSTSSYVSSVIAPYLAGGVRDYSIDVGALALTAGNYWVGYSPNGIDRNIHWSFASGGDGLSALSTDGGGSWSTPYPSILGLAFRIEGIANVPEPSIAALIGIGLLGVWAGRKKRKT